MKHNRFSFKKKDVAFWLVTAFFEVIIFFVTHDALETLLGPIMWTPILAIAFVAIDWIILFPPPAPGAHYLWAAWVLANFALALIVGLGYNWFVAVLVVIVKALLVFGRARMLQAGHLENEGHLEVTRK